jgi:hypothetical protein
MVSSPTFTVFAPVNLGGQRSIINIGIYGRRGEEPHRAISVWLEHRHTDVDRPVVAIGTLDPMTLGPDPRPHLSPLMLAADDAMSVLIDLSVPWQDDGEMIILPPQPELISEVSRFADLATYYVEQWDRRDWVIDGKAQSAHIWEFGHGWLGVTPGPNDTYLSVVGIGSMLPTIELAPLTDPTHYGIDLSQPINAAAITYQRQLELQDGTLPRTTNYHPDWLAAANGELNPARPRRDD